jgi:hypothetical protein
MLPSSSFLYLYFMALRVLGFHLLDQIGVCCVGYAWRRLRWDYYFLYIGGVLYVLRILLSRIVPHRLCYTYYTYADIYRWGYCFLVFVSVVEKLWANAFFRRVLWNRLVTLCTGGPWKVKGIHLLFTLFFRWDCLCGFCFVCDKFFL